MCNRVVKSMTTSVLAHTEDGRYVLRPGDTGALELVPANVFHLAVFPPEMLDENGLIKPGTVLETVRVENGFIYPNHKVYRPVGDKLQIPRQESKEVEFKASFFVTGAGKYSKAEKLIEIASVLTGFSNSKVEGTLYVGVRDGGIVGENVEKEVEGNPTEFEADFRNKLSQITGSQTFGAKHLIFNWERCQGKLYCRIQVKPYPEILFVGGIRLCLRSEAAATVTLRNKEIVDFVKGWQP